MDSSVEELEKKIALEIENKHYLKAINSLTIVINNKMNKNYKYNLLRSHCYQQLLTEESLNMAYDDVVMAIKLAENQFQCYLQGAFVYLDQKKFDFSFQLFQKSIQINPQLRHQLRDILSFVKFKALRKRGFAEDISFKHSLSFETIGECIEAINSSNDYKNLNILQFINNNKCEVNSNDSVLQNICNNLTNSLSLIDDNNSCCLNSNDIKLPLRMRSFSQVVSQSKDEMRANYNEWKPINDFSSGDQPLDCKAIVRSIGSTAICRPNTGLNLDQNNLKSLQFSSTELSFLDSNNSVEKWINNDSNYENVAKLCNFERQQKTSECSDNTITDNKSKISISSLKSLPMKRKPTNLHKLRGVYIGNLKTSFDHKVMRNRFKNYGTIVDFYQPLSKGFAFIHFNNEKSATDMIADWQSVRVDECRDNLKLNLRFIPTQDQMQKYNSLSYSEYRKKVVDNNECDYWRSGSKCKYGFQCFYKHIPINKSIDTLPDERKAKWKLYK